MEYKKEIIICTNCFGVGKTELHTYVQKPNKGFMNVTLKVCDTCKGTGRLIEQTKVNRKAFDVKKIKGVKKKITNF